MFLAVIRTIWNCVVLIGGIIVAVLLTTSSREAEHNHSLFGIDRTSTGPTPTTVVLTSSSSQSQQALEILNDFLPFTLVSLDTTSIDLSEYKYKHHSLFC